jgi:hypothetical protein
MFTLAMERGELLLCRGFVTMLMELRNRFTLAARIQNGASRDVVGVLGMNAGRVARRSRLGLTVLIM